MIERRRVVISDCSPERPRGRPHPLQPGDSRFRRRDCRRRGVGADGGVAPELQRQGIGRMLIERGNELLRDTGCPFIAVLGHSEYYPRFGFKPASGFGIRSEREMPDEVFMVMIVDPPRMKGVSRLARYREEFSGVV